MTDTNDSPGWAACGGPRKDHRNMMRLLAALATWAVCFVGSSQLLKRGLIEPSPLGWLVGLTPSVAALVALFAFARYVREADELQRLIQLQAMAVSLGGTFFAIAGYQVLEKLGAPALDANDYTLVMSGLYTLGILVGWRKYR
ncbi:MAG: hypothetical protein AAGN66_03355 [Acidobacteriota bacterium]